MNRINLAVIGGGYWGKKVIAETLALGQAGCPVNLYSVADSSPIALEHCKREFGPLNYCLDYRELVSDPNITAVHLCSPNSTHFQIASDMLRHGKHVLVEKPLATKPSEAFELVRLAKETKRILSVGHVHRFNNGVRSLRRLLFSGVLGDLYYLRFRWTGFLGLQANREVISDLGPHPLDISNNLLDSWPSKVACKGRGFRTGAGYEMASIYAEHFNGPDVSIELSWLDPEKRREVTVVGSEGSAQLDCLGQRLLLLRKTGNEHVLIVPSNTLREEIFHFTQCIEWNSYPGRYTNFADGTLGANVVRLLEASTRSLREERTIRVQTMTEDPLSMQEQMPIIRTGA